MIRFDSDHVSWVLVVILAAMALLLAMVSSRASAGVRLADSPAVGAGDQIRAASQLVAQDRKGIRSPSELWNVACERYRAGRLNEATRMFETVAATYPSDPTARMWAGMAMSRMGNRARALEHWRAVWGDESAVVEYGVWPAVALAAAELEAGRPDRAARYIVPLERGDYGLEFAEHPLVSFYAALVYEQLAIAAPKYREAVEESLGDKFSPSFASNDGSQMLNPNSRSWLIFLARRALQRTNRGARSLDWEAPVVPESAAVEPSFVPTVRELLEALGSADFASQARGKLRALQLYESPPKRTIENFDDPELFKARPLHRVSHTRPR
jgi:hypothetical protein